MVLDYKNPDSPFIKIVKSVDETALGFNVKYLSPFAGEEISILILNPISPAVILEKDSQIDPHSKFLKEDILKEDWLYVLMPIKLDEEESNEVYM
jgi:DNA polymerase III sliding clamp (beta) subunit (PCNA family)